MTAFIPYPWLTPEEKRNAKAVAAVQERIDTLFDSLDLQATVRLDVLLSEAEIWLNEIADTGTDVEREGVRRRLNAFSDFCPQIVGYNPYRSRML